MKLTPEQLDLMCDIFHSYKDYNRNFRETILKVMELESALTSETNGEYQPDTTYNI